MPHDSIMAALRELLRHTDHIVRNHARGIIIRLTIPPEEPHKPHHVELPETKVPDITY